jgi:hypothetical protein
MPDPVSDYLARIGSKGGKASGPRKARSPEQYKAMAAKSAEARKAKRESRLASQHKTESRNSAATKRGKSKG